MVVRAPMWLSGAVRWRWTPTLALVVGSLLFVLGVVTLVPSKISFSENETPAAARGMPGSELSPASGVEAFGPDESESEVEPAPDPPSRKTKRARRRAAASPTEAAGVDDAAAVDPAVE